MIQKKTIKEVEIMKVGGHILASVLRAVAARIVPGVRTSDLERYAQECITSHGATPAFLGYQPYGAAFPYPAALCISVNEEVVHGIPGDRVLTEGMIVSIDCGVWYQGMVTDHAITLPVGTISKKDAALISTTQAALTAGIAAAQLGNRIGDISNAIEHVVKKGKYGIIRELAGHGVGREIHEDPYVPNYGKAGKGALLETGMTFAIEPMITLGGEAISILEDGYTIVTRDGSKSAHFEHTIAIAENGPVILTA
jgi:methionyl aminopeptidase